MCACYGTTVSLLIFFLCVTIFIFSLHTTKIGAVLLAALGVLKDAPRAHMQHIFPIYIHKIDRKVYLL